MRNTIRWFSKKAGGESDLDRRMIRNSFLIGKPGDLRDTFSVWRRPRVRHRMAHAPGRRRITTIPFSSAAARSIMGCGFACQKESGGRDGRVTK
ncbi:MAG TPA: hypothetical protein PKW52_02790, partial [Nitrospira sp.]|nr:hypothetical protein [Nitrospira sp.]